MKELHKLSEESKRTIHSLAAEFKFAQELEEHLQKIQEESLHVDQKIREANQMLQVYRWLARGERKAARSEGQLEKMLSDLKQSLPDKLQLVVRTMEQQLRIADRTLQKLASYHGGKIRPELDEIDEEEKLLRSLTKSGKPNPAADAVKLRLEREIAGLKENLGTLGKWLKTNVIIVNSILTFTKSLEPKVA